MSVLFRVELNDSAMSIPSARICVDQYAFIGHYSLCLELYSQRT